MSERRAPAGRREAALSRLGALSSVPSPELRRAARLAAHLAAQPHGTPHAAVHLLDEQHQHRVAAVGVPLVRTALRESMCVRVVDDGAAVYTEDATTEPVFVGNPFTTGPEPVRLYYSTPLRLGDGLVVGTLCVFDTRPGTLSPLQRGLVDDLALSVSSHLELTGMSRELAHLATHDALTQVANRVLLGHELEAAMEDPRRAPWEPSLLLADLQGFKAVNDRYGHAVGDEVLQSTARRLRDSCREGDLVARYGGDEFVLLVRTLPDPALLERIAHRVETTSCKEHLTRAGLVPCRLTIGVAQGRPGELPYELLGRADEAMYARKPAVPAPR